jgi:hypothetical protein
VLGGYSAHSPSSVRFAGFLVRCLSKPKFSRERAEMQSTESVISPEVSALLDQITSQLADFRSAYAPLSLRERVLRLIEIQDALRSLGIATAIASGCNASAARERIRAYFVRYPNEIIDGVELAVVSGISEYGRRVRELRKDDHMPIVTGAEAASLDQELRLRPDQYMLRT